MPDLHLGQKGISGLHLAQKGRHLSGLLLGQEDRCVASLYSECSCHILSPPDRGNIQKENCIYLQLRIDLISKLS